MCSSDLVFTVHIHEKILAVFDASVTNINARSRYQGIPEMIDHRQNGYVAEYKNADDLANGIHWVLKEADPEMLSTNARKKVEDNYSEDVVAKLYIALYHILLS